MMFDHPHALVEWINNISTFTNYSIHVLHFHSEGCTTFASMLPRENNHGCQIRKQSLLIAFIVEKLPKKLSQTLFFILHSTIYREIFTLLNFHKFRESCSVAKLNFAKVLPCHTFYIAHVDHL